MSEPLHLKNHEQMESKVFCFAKCPCLFLLDYMKQTTFEAQAFLEAVQFFRQEKGHYGSWEMITGDEIQVTRGSAFWILFSVWVVGGQGHNKQSNKQKSGKAGRCGPRDHFSHCLKAFGQQAHYWAPTPNTTRPGTK